MPRIARLVAVGLPHHITQRGNYRQNIFSADSDRQQYLYWIQEYSIQYGLSMLAYCLMQNHVHFIAIPNKEDSLAKTFNTAHMRYSQYFNKKLRQSGHLWQGRFYSCILDEPHLLMAAKYIERNPVRAKVVKRPWEWKWSSALAHIGGGDSQLCVSGLFKIVDVSCKSWKQYIDSPEDEKSVVAIRKHTLTGRPLCMPAFVEKLEKRFNRRLSSLPMGRPRKEENK